MPDSVARLRQDAKWWFASSNNDGAWKVDERTANMTNRQNRRHTYQIPSYSMLFRLA